MVGRCIGVEQGLIRKYYLVLLHIGASAYILAYQIYMFVKHFGEYKAFLNPSCKPCIRFKPALYLMC